MNITRSRTSRVGVSAALITAMAAFPAAAQRDAPDLSTRLADLEARYQRLVECDSSDRWLTEERSREIRALVADVLADADSRASLLDDDEDEDMDAGWDDAFFLEFETSDERFKLEIEGQVQLRHVFNQRNAAADDDGDDSSGGFEARRVRLEFGGYVYDKMIRYNIKGSYERATGMMTLNDATIQLRFSPEWALSLGRFRQAVLREEDVSSKRQLLVERSSVEEAFAQQRAVGVGLDYSTDRFRASASFMDVSDGLFESNGWLGTARAELIVWGEGGFSELKDFTSFPDDDPVVMIGAGVLYQDEDFEDDEDDDEQVFRWTADVSLEFGGWNAFAAIVGNQFDDDDGNSFDQLGIVVQGGVFLTDELEIFAQYAWGDADDDGFDLSTATLGFNYYFAGHALKLTSDVGYAFEEFGDIWASSGTGWLEDAEGSTGQVVVRTQFQLLF